MKTRKRSNRVGMIKGIAFAIIMCMGVLVITNNAKQLPTKGAPTIKYVVADPPV